MRFVYMMLGGLLVAVMISIVPALSQDGMEGDDAEEEQDLSDEAWMKLQQPNEHHKWLLKSVGEWDIEFKMFMEGAPEPVTMTGTSKVVDKWGRYAHEEYTIGDENFQMHGQGYIGYDNGAGEYRAMYIGSMGTSMTMYTGQRSDDGKTLTLVNERFEKNFGNMKVSERLVITDINDDKSTFTFYGKYGDEDERKIMEMTYTRKAADQPSDAEDPTRE